MNRRPTGVLPVWRRFVRTGHPPGFYRCGDKIMTAGSNRASTGVGRNCRDNRVGDLRVPFLNLPTVPSDVNKRRALKEDCQPGFYQCDDDIAGITRSRLGQTLFLNPPATSPARTGGGQDDVPTGLLPVWRRNCSHRVMPGRVRRPGIPVTATTLPANRILIRKSLRTIPTGLLPVWLGLRSRSGN